MTKDELLEEALRQLRNLTGLAEMRGGNLHEYGAAIKDAKDLIARASLTEKESP